MKNIKLSTMSSGEEVVLSSNTVLDQDLHYDYEDLKKNLMIYDEPKSVSQIWDGESQNVLVLSILLCLALITNLSAAPVILFRRTRLIKHSNFG